MLWPKTTSFTNAFLVEALVDIIKEKNVFPPEKFGMRYIHIPNLGIESENRQALHTKEDYQALFAKYRKTLMQKTAELRDLNNLVQKEKRVAITCFEQDVAYCHRGVIAKEIHKRYGTQIKHL